MDVEDQIYSLSAETLALQTLLVQVFNNLAALGPELRQAVEHGFDDAVAILEVGAMKFGNSASPKHTLKAIQIVDQLRGAIFPLDEAPKRDA